MTTSGYATFSSDYPLDFTNVDGLTAFRADNNDGTSITMEEVSGVVPARTGLFLKGTASTEYSISTSTDTPAEVGTNLLEPTTGGALAAGDYVYIFAEHAFCELTNTPTVSKGKAYIPASAIECAKGSLSIDWGDETGVESVQSAESGVQSAYNLAGQKVNAGYHGIVIVGGKKVLR